MVSRTRRLAQFVPVVVVLAALTACGASAEPAAAPAADSAADSGAAAFARNCSSCHGADLRGTTGGPSLLSIVYEPNHHPDAAFRAAARKGVQPHHWDFGAMPPVEGLSDADLEAIIAFVRETQQREGFEEYPPN